MKLKLFLLSLTFILSVFAYQNCGDIKLATLASNAEVLVIQKDFGSLCAPENIDVSLPQKILIMMDMSASNTYRFQEVVTDPHDNDWRDRYYLGQSAIDKCLDSGGTIDDCKATDLNGIRFEAVKNYLNNCPQNNHVDNLFGIIGFSTYPVKPVGFSHRSCEDQLTSKSVALQEIHGLKRIQSDALNLNFPVRSHSYPFTNIAQTSYMNAFQCLETRIYEDINPIAFQRDYKVLFVTDGKPSDKLCSDGSYSPDGTCNHGSPGTDFNNQLYINKLLDLKINLNNLGYNLIFQPIYYGLNVGVHSQEHQEAIAKLDEMADTVNTITGIETQIIDPNSQDFSNQLSNSLCNSPVESLSVPYDIYGAPQFISLTSIQIGSQLFADTDMDGLSDELEDYLHENTSLNFYKDKSRSNANLLDSLCYRYLNECKNFVASSPSCNVNQTVGFGFTACDKKFIDNWVLKIHENDNLRPFDGIDYDGDGILDYVELIKGLNMFSANDAILINDGDGVDAISEVLRGTDPRSYTSVEIVKAYAHDVSFSFDHSCSNGQGLRLQAGHIPLIKNIGELQESFITSRQAGENVYVIFYFAKPIAIDSKRTRVLARLLKINTDQSFELGELVEVGTVVQP